MLMSLGFVVVDTGPLCWLCAGTACSVSVCIVVVAALCSICMLYCSEIARGLGSSSGSAFVVPVPVRMVMCIC
jgi:hypothetical protein